MTQDASRNLSPAGSEYIVIQRPTTLLQRLRFLSQALFIKLPWKGTTSLFLLQTLLFLLGRHVYFSSAGLPDVHFLSHGFARTKETNQPVKQQPTSIFRLQTVRRSRVSVERSNRCLVRSKTKVPRRPKKWNCKRLVQCRLSDSSIMIAPSSQKDKCWAESSKRVGSTMKLHEWKKINVDQSETTENHRPSQKNASRSAEVTAFAGLQRHEIKSNRPKDERFRKCYPNRFKPEVLQALIQYIEWIQCDLMLLACQGLLRKTGGTSPQCSVKTSGWSFCHSLERSPRQYSIWVLMKCCICSN